MKLRHTHSGSLKTATRNLRTIWRAWFQMRITTELLMRMTVFRRFHLPHFTTCTMGLSIGSNRRIRMMPSRRLPVESKAQYVSLEQLPLPTVCSDFVGLQCCPRLRRQPYQPGAFDVYQQCYWKFVEYRCLWGGGILVQIDGDINSKKMYLRRERCYSTR